MGAQDRMTYSRPLPDAASPNLTLVNPTPEEMYGVWKLNGASWSGALSIPTYIERELHLASQDATKDGGILYWALTDITEASGERRLLSTFETYRRRALVNVRGEVKDGICYGIGSVFCPPQYRGRKYASRMMTEYSKLLKRVNNGDNVPFLERSLFSMLYSDIGKKFYDVLGWKTFSSDHMELPPLTSPILEHPQFKITPLHAKDLPDICAADEMGLRATILSDSGKHRVLVIPDVETMNWHHAREDFLSAKLIHRDFSVKGIRVIAKDGTSGTCVWTHLFGDKLDADGTPKGSLCVLRIVCKDGLDDIAKFLLQAAQAEASTSKLLDVHIWAPSETVLRAGRAIAKNSGIREDILVHRAEESIPALMWLGQDTEGDSIEPGEASIEWLGSEKFAWC